MASKVLISFDIEEFDLPRENGAEISLEEGVKVSAVGLSRILEMCQETGIKATFFVTGNFARECPELVREIVEDGHEVACHGVDHFKPVVTDVAESKKILEKVAGVKVEGYRQPRMFEIDYDELKNNGYLYDSSVNPAWVPGRYNHRDVPRKPFMKKGILEIPTSVATGLRVPLFWLALHVFPKRMYLRLAKMSLKKTGYLATYFHPWEFAEISGYKVQKYIIYNSGRKLVKRLSWVISELQKSGYEFSTYAEYSKTWYNANDGKGEETI